MKRRLLHSPPPAGEGLYRRDSRDRNGEARSRKIFTLRIG
jgi:hypothetical protein